MQKGWVRAWSRGKTKEMGGAAVKVGVKYSGWGGWGVRINQDTDHLRETSGMVCRKSGQGGAVSGRLRESPDLSEAAPTFAWRLVDPGRCAV